MKNDFEATLRRSSLPVVRQSSPRNRWFILWDSQAIRSEVVGCYGEEGILHLLIEEGGMKNPHQQAPDLSRLSYARGRQQCPEAGEENRFIRS